MFGNESDDSFCSTCSGSTDLSGNEVGKKHKGKRRRDHMLPTRDAMSGAYSGKYKEFSSESEQETEVDVKKNDFSQVDFLRFNSNLSEGMTSEDKANNAYVTDNDIPPLEELEESFNDDMENNDQNTDFRNTLMPKDPCILTAQLTEKNQIGGNLNVRKIENHETKQTDYREQKETNQLDKQENGNSSNFMKNTKSSNSQTMLNFVEIDDERISKYIMKDFNEEIEMKSNCENKIIDMTESTTKLQYNDNQSIYTMFRNENNSPNQSDVSHLFSIVDTTSNDQETNTNFNEITDLSIKPLIHEIEVPQKPLIFEINVEGNPKDEKTLVESEITEEPREKTSIEPLSTENKHLQKPSKFEVIEQISPEEKLLKCEIMETPQKEAAMAFDIIEDASINPAIIEEYKKPSTKENETRKNVKNTSKGKKVIGELKHQMLFPTTVIVPQTLYLKDSSIQDNCAKSINKIEIMQEKNEGTENQTSTSKMIQESLALNQNPSVRDNTKLNITCLDYNEQQKLLEANLSKAITFSTTREIEMIKDPIAHSLMYERKEIDNETQNQTLNLELQNEMTKISEKEPLSDQTKNKEQHPLQKTTTNKREPILIDKVNKADGKQLIEESLRSNEIHELEESSFSKNCLFDIDRNGERDTVLEDKFLQKEELQCDVLRNNTQWPQGDRVLSNVKENTEKKIPDQCSNTNTDDIEFYFLKSKRKITEEQFFDNTEKSIANIQSDYERNSNPEAEPLHINPDASILESGNYGLGTKTFKSLEEIQNKTSEHKLIKDNYETSYTQKKECLMSDLAKVLIPKKSKGDERFTNNQCSNIEATITFGETVRMPLSSVYKLQDVDQDAILAEYSGPCSFDNKMLKKRQSFIHNKVLKLSEEAQIDTNYENFQKIPPENPFIDKLNKMFPENKNVRRNLLKPCTYEIGELEMDIEENLPRAQSPVTINISDDSAEETDAEFELVPPKYTTDIEDCNIVFQRTHQSPSEETKMNESSKEADLLPESFQKHKTDIESIDETKSSDVEEYELMIPPTDLRERTPEELEELCKTVIDCDTDELEEPTPHTTGERCVQCSPPTQPKEIILLPDDDESE